MNIDTPIVTLESLQSGAINLDQMRSQLRINDAISDLNDVANILRYDWETLSKNQIEAQRLRVDVARIKLAKAMPDMKAIEHSVGDPTSKVQFVINLGDDGTKKL
jgi:hypothetical protein